MVDRDDGAEPRGSAGPTPGADGGDPVCWLEWVCPACGRLADDRAARRCARCGAELSAD